MLVFGGNRGRGFAVLMRIMVAARSLDDLHYYQERAEQCRKAAEEATDPSVRVAHQQLAKFYEARMASAQESAALRSGDGAPPPATA